MFFTNLKKYGNILPIALLSLLLMGLNRCEDEDPPIAADVSEDQMVEEGQRVVLVGKVREVLVGSFSNPDITDRFECRWDQVSRGPSSPDLILKEENRGERVSFTAPEVTKDTLVTLQFTCIGLIDEKQVVTDYVKVTIKDVHENYSEARREAPGKYNFVFFDISVNCNDNTSIDPPDENLNWGIRINGLNATIENEAPVQCPSDFDLKAGTGGGSKGTVTEPSQIVHADVLRNARKTSCGWDGSSPAFVWNSTRSSTCVQSGQQVSDSNAIRLLFFKDGDSYSACGSSANELESSGGLRCSTTAKVTAEKTCCSD